jgi:diguanylate cyclase (GGDEF)-like protein
MNILHFEDLNTESLQHTLLKKQIEKVEKYSGPLDPLNYFLSLIDLTYSEADRERRISEHTMRTMADEVMENNQDLMKQAEELKASQERYFLASEAANDALWDWNLQTGKVYYSKRWREMLNIPDDKITDTIEDWFSRIHPDHRKIVKQSIDQHLQGITNKIEIEHQLKTEQNQYLWILVRGLTSQKDGKVIRIAGSQTDITFRKHYEESLYKSAFHDELTGLANRALFINRLDQVISRTKRLGEKGAAVLFVDLDRFKYINDTLGHEMGDEVLKIVAKVLQNHTRATDTVSRFGGDEFTVILDPIYHLDEAKAIAERILKSLNKSYRITRKEVHIASSIGLTLVTRTMTNAESVLRNADLAMYQAKSGGKSRLEIFDQTQHEKLLLKMQIEADLRYYISRDKLLVFYQPIVDLKTSKVASFEALLRWFHPKRGYISPVQFIPLAEEVGLIGKIGQSVLEKVILQLKAWIDEVGEEDCPHIGVNISVRQLMDDNHFDLIILTLKALGDYCRFIHVEITESVIIKDPDLMIKRLEEITVLGIKISIDDFGIGYSSLSYLHNFPFDTLKIDKEFISGMMIEKKTEQLVKTMITLAKDLNLKTVAEGIENIEQMKKLQELGCTYGQGYYFSLPLRAEDATSIVVQQSFQTKQSKITQ